jgi:DegV family protein with EDD domain
MSFTILTDTSANLPTGLLRDNNISVVPFTYLINDKEYTCLDTEEFDGRKFYKAMRLGAKIKTSQINVFNYIHFFEPFLERGEDILMICMSSGISGSFRSACLARQELADRYPDSKIRLVDTLGASLGEGLFALRAVELRGRGYTVDQAYEKIEAEKHRMYQVFTVDDLMYLKNTGRVKGSTAIVGNMLQIKPLLKGNENGEIVTFNKVLGRKKAIESLAQRYSHLVSNPELQTVGIAHADCEDDARCLAELINKRKPPKDILTVMYEPVTGSHVGPGTLALFFMGGDGVREK